MKAVRCDPSLPRLHSPSSLHPDQKTTTRYNDYDRFAWFYNRHWGSVFTSRVISVLDELLLHDLEPGARVLDVCCGTGQMATELLQRGFLVTGLDGSEQMLHYARQNAPDAEFILSDAPDFSLPAQFQVVLSTFDSLNHVLPARAGRTFFFARKDGD